MRGGGRWSEAVPEETLSRADAERVVRRLIRMLRPYRARIAGIVIVLLSQVGTLLAGPALVRYGIDHGMGLGMGRIGPVGPVAQREGSTWDG